MKFLSVCVRCAGVLTASYSAPPEPSADAKRIIGGDKVVALIREIESVEAFRVGSVEDFKKGETAGADEAVAGRVIVAKGVGVAMPKEFAPKLIAALLADDTYLKSDSKGTTKNAGIGFRGKTKDGSIVEVSYCLVKGNVFLRVVDSTGKVLKYGDCRGFRDDKQAPLRSLAAEAFPDDAEVQKHKPKPADNAIRVPDAKGPFEAGSKVAKLADGFAFTEGPTSDKDGNVYFTDQPSDRILKWSVDGKLSTFLEKSGRANGLCFDADGKLWSCSDEKNELWKIDVATKEHEVVVKDYKRKLLNGPNDVWVAPDGGAYFSDPFYKRKWWDRGPEEQDKRGVYHVSAKGVVTRVADDFKQPNGVIGTADGKTLYVADIGGKQTFAFDIKDDGMLANRRKFCDMGSDGMTLDADGNVYLTGSGVVVFDKTGKKIAELAVPEQPSNLCFGGKDQKTLFITARTSLYAIPTRVAGGARQ